MDIRALSRPVSAALLLGAGALAITALPVAAAENFVVRSNQDGGDVNVGDDLCDANPAPQVRCTLRAAIEEANGDGDRDRIAFRIGGPNATGVKVIAAPTDLPDITEPLTIDGYTQPSSRPNTAKLGTNAKIRILLSGAGFHGLDLRAPVEIRGLAITGFTHGIEVHEHGAVIAGNFIGTNAAGTASGGGLHGIVVFDGRARIGGGDRADRNLVSGYLNNGIVINGNAARTIRGNLIGTKANGRAGLGNGTGILVEDSRRVVIGGARPSMGNVIAFNQGPGIWVESLTNSDTASALIRRNSIFANVDEGIRLDAGGGGSNDNNPPLDSPPPPDTDIGANDLQNHPVVSSAKSGPDGTAIRGRLLSLPNRSYRVELFANPSGNEGKTYLGSRVVSTDGDGIARWSFRTVRRVPIGHGITATASDLSDNETSAFSPPRSVVSS